MNRSAFLLLLSLILPACSSSLPPPISRFEMQAPRPFGYVIGDEIHHRIQIQTRKDVKLIDASIPGKGKVNRWLELTHVDHTTDDSGITLIDLTYQVFYAPNEVKMLNIPGFSLQFTQAGKTVEQSVPAWPFTLSPIKELAVRKDDEGLDYRRPDTLPEPLSAQRHWQALTASLTLAAAIGAYLLTLYGVFPLWPKRRVFKQALNQIRRVSDNDPQQALAALHRAFNTLNGRPLFKHGLADFYARHPQFSVLAEDIERFFDVSNHVLFGGQSELDRDPLIALCRRCRDIECGRR